ncbi:MAG: hypothetical protein V2J25_11090 [Desulfatiglans sp.]|nr:hypothetical protein [Desulfatiglans sp.]
MSQAIDRVGLMAIELFEAHVLEALGDLSVQSYLRTVNGLCRREILVVDKGVTKFGSGSDRLDIIGKGHCIDVLVSCLTMLQQASLATTTQDDRFIDLHDMPLYHI